MSSDRSSLPKKPRGSIEFACKGRNEFVTHSRSGTRIRSLSKLTSHLRMDICMISRSKLKEKRTRQNHLSLHCLPSLVPTSLLQGIEPKGCRGLFAEDWLLHSRLGWFVHGLGSCKAKMGKRRVINSIVPFSREKKRDESANFHFHGNHHKRTETFRF